MSARSKKARPASSGSNVARAEAPAPDGPLRWLFFFGGPPGLTTGCGFVCSQTIPPLRDQPAALVWWHIVFLDRTLNGGLFVRRIDNADQFRGRALDVVDGPGVILLCCYRQSLRHRGHLFDPPIG